MDYSYYNPFLPHNEKELMEYVGSENIFKLIFGNIPLEGKFKSPFREDDTPGCFFWDAPGVNLLLFVDYGDLEKTHYNAIEFIQKYHKFESSAQAVEFIREKLKDFRPEGSNIPTYVSKVAVKRSVITPKVFKIFPRQWDEKDRIFWSSYGITKKQLIEDGVIPINYYQIYENNTFNTYIPFSNAYAYTFPEPNIVKIYTPHSKSLKWITNANNNIIGNIENIDPSGDKLIITKSYKDCRVLRNLGYKNVIWFQSESQSPRIDILLDIIANYKKVYVFYDNDSVGLFQSKKLADFVNNLLDTKKLTPINIPIQHSDTKDISDYNKKFKEEQSIQLINKITKNGRKN